MPKLSALAVKSAPPGKHEDGNGLRLVKREDGGGEWVLRYTLHGRRREMGLGGLASLSLKDAREMAAEYRTMVLRGLDPVEDRRRARQKAVRDRHLLRDVARDAFESRKAELKGDGIAGRWYSPLALHIVPKPGKMPVTAITQVGAAKDFRVPLSLEAQRVIDLARPHARGGCYLFPSVRKGVISDATMSRLMERRGLGARLSLEPADLAGRGDDRPARCATWAVDPRQPVPCHAHCCYSRSAPSSQYSVKSQHLEGRRGKRSGCLGDSTRGTGGRPTAIAVSRQRKPVLS